jgi:hypothetical protein
MSSRPRLRCRRRAARHRPGGCGHPRRSARRRSPRRGDAPSGRRSPNARAARSAASAWCRCAAARPAQPTHSDATCARAASGADARRRDERAPSRPSSGDSRPGRPAWPARNWCAPWRPGCAARWLRPAATDTTRAPADARGDTPATLARPLWPAASDATSDAPWPAKRHSEQPRTGSSTHSRSNGSTATGRPRRAGIYRLPRPVSFEGLVVADRTLHRGPDASLSRSRSPWAAHLARAPSEA